MSSTMVQFLLLAAIALLVSGASALDDTYMYTESESSEDSGYGLPSVLQGGASCERNNVRLPYTHGKLPGLGECNDCGFVIVEKRHHYCIPGKSVIKVLRRKPTCNCKTPAGSGGYYGAESKQMAKYELPTKGSDPVFRMLRGLMDKRENGDGAAVATKLSTPQYQAHEAVGSASRTAYN